MSTVIHNGIVFRGLDLAGAYRLLEGFGARIAAFTERDLARFLADVACRRLDTATVTGAATDDPPLSLAWDEIDRGRRDDAKGLRHPATDFEFRVGLFPLGDDVYGMVRTERHAWFEAMLAELAPAVAEFAYWDNTDRPDNLRAAEWSRRGKIWDRIAREQIRGRVFGGCAVDLTRHLEAPEPEALMAALPDFERRASRTAKDLAVAHFLENAPGAEASGADAKIAAVLKAPDWLKSPEGRERLAAERRRAEALLPREISYEDLRRPVAAAPGPRP